MTEETQIEPEIVEPEDVEAERGPESIAGEIVVEDDLGGEGSAEDSAPEPMAAEDGAAEDGAPEAVAADASLADEEDEAISAEAALIVQLQAELAEAQVEALAHMDKLQRLGAEFQNSKKRQARQLSDAIQRASEHLVERLLPVLDDFDLAFDNVPDNVPDDVSAEDEAWVEGFRQIQEKLNAILQDQGVTAIACEGEFDPSLHEAITSEPNDDVESGHIIATLRTGYEFKGRVLRPAMVRVAS